MSIIKIVFMWLLSTGAVEPMNDTNDGRELYYLYIIDDEYNVKPYGYAYKEEIYNYIVTGKFIYNEDFTEDDFANVNSIKINSNE